MTQRVLRLLGCAVVTIAGVGVLPWAQGQMHKVAPPETVVRAVGVYEWTGEITKPTASRLIPVSLFLDGHLEDAGVYMARPVPFALDTGTVYEVEQSGIAKGLIELQFARHLASNSAATDFDDGWFGYGSFKVPAAAKPEVASHRAAGGHRADRSQAVVDDDPDRPHLIRKPGSEGDDAGSSGTASNGGKKSSGSDSSADAKNTGVDEDPDRPHLTRRPESTSGGQSGSGTDGQSSTDQSSGSGTASGSGSGSGANPADDPDRPTLKKRTPEQQKQARQEADHASVSGESTTLNEDPDRPKLQRGVPTHALTETALPKLQGIPENLHQMVAVSDAKTRSPHDFTRPWTDEAERQKVLVSMQALALTLLNNYGKTDGSSAPTLAARAATGAKTSSPSSTSSTASASSKATTAGSKTTGSKTATSGASSGSSSSSAGSSAGAAKPGVHNTLRRKVATGTVAPPVPLLDEELRGYTLSYGGADTFVYMAHTDGNGGAVRYVTVVAQRDAMGELKPALQSVTDGAHLDRAPRLRLVDVVDAEASNRASLLFELRGQTARQFALYRVLAARADQTFLTGTTP
jgi:hypothetical protein